MAAGSRPSPRRLPGGRAPTARRLRSARRRSRPGRDGGRVSPGRAPISRQVDPGRTCRAQRQDDGERHDGLPRPAGEVVDREAAPTAASRTISGGTGGMRCHGHWPSRARKHFVKTRACGMPPSPADVVAASRRRRRRRPSSARRTTRSWSTGRAAPRTSSTRCRRRGAGRAVRSRACRSVRRSRRPRKWSQNRCSAIIVAFDSSSPTHQPLGCWSSSRRLRARVDRPVEAVSSCTTVMPATACMRIDPTRRRKTAANRALHRRRPAGVGPGARRGRRSGCPSPARAARAACRGEARRSRSGSRLTRDQRSSAWPSRPVELVRPSARRGLVPADLEQVGHAARDDGQVLASARASCPVSSPRSKTQWAGDPSSAASGERRSGRSNSRWTETIGDGSSPGSGSPRRRADSAGGQRDDDRVASSSVDGSRRGGRLRPSRRAASSARRRRRRAWLTERPGREDHVGSRRPCRAAPYAR